MVDVLREEFGVDAQMIKGHGGIFEVRVNNAVVSKKTMWGFPSEDEIVHAVAAALNSAGTSPGAASELPPVPKDGG